MAGSFCAIASDDEQFQCAGGGSATCVFVTYLPEQLSPAAHGRAFSVRIVWRKNLGIQSRLRLVGAVPQQLPGLVPPGRVFVEPRITGQRLACLTITLPTLLPRCQRIG